MRLELDENLPQEVVEALEAAGHDAETVVGEGLGGADDPTVLGAAERESRALLTLDVDFANVVAYSPTGRSGIVVLRPARQSRAVVLRLVRRPDPAARQRGARRQAVGGRRVPRPRVPVTPAQPPFKTRSLPSRRVRPTSSKCSRRGIV